MKIATCCHCGSKATLILDQNRHELSCASCGAPLRDFKALPKEKAAAPRRTAISHRPAVRKFPEKETVKAYKKTKPRKSKKKRKGWLREMAEEVFDLVEDVFD